MLRDNHLHASHTKKLARSRVLLAFLREFPLVNGAPNFACIAKIGKLRGQLWGKRTQICDIELSLRSIWRQRGYLDSSEADLHYRGCPDQFMYCRALAVIPKAA